MRLTVCLERSRLWDLSHLSIFVVVDHVKAAAHKVGRFVVGRQDCAEDATCWSPLYDFTNEEINPLFARLQPPRVGVQSWEMLRVGVHPEVPMGDVVAA